MFYKLLWLNSDFLRKKKVVGTVESVPCFSVLSKKFGRFNLHVCNLFLDKLYGSVSYVKNRLK